MEKLNVYRNVPSSSVSGSRKGAESVNIRSCVGDNGLAFVERLISMRAFGADENIAPNIPF
ncbi:MAG: hypothetical protein K6G94_05535, partial [Kiritimatiellae bacterium]|nr:hypothetical protein [Kiritimatiellia bacterium]